MSKYDKDTHEEWMDAEGSETGEAMGWLFNVAYEYPEYTSKAVQETCKDELDRLVDELKLMFKLDASGEMVLINE